jgi:uncharacterized membrane protein
MALAAIIAVAGLLTDSVVLIIGAMILGPDFGPLAGTCVALATRHRDALRRSLVALAAGVALYRHRVRERSGPGRRAAGLPGG